MTNTVLTLVPGFLRTPLPALREYSTTSTDLSTPQNRTLCLPVYQASANWFGGTRKASSPDQSKREHAKEMTMCGVKSPLQVP